MNGNLTWRLWQRLCHPPVESPIYLRALGGPTPRIPWYTGCAEVVGFALFVPLFLFMGPVYGVAWTVGIATRLADARAGGAYDVAAVTPGGPLAVAWAQAAAALHRGNTFANVNAGNTWAGRGIIVFVVYFVFVLSPQTRAGGSPVVPLIAMTALAAFVVVDHVQSIVLAVLVGMAAPSSERVNAQMMAFAAYAAVQLAGYLTALATVALLQALTIRLGWSEAASVALIGVGAVLAFALTREWLIRRLWRAVLTRLNGDPTVLDRVSVEGI